MYMLIKHILLTWTRLYLNTSWSKAPVFSATAICASFSCAWYLSRCNFKSAAVCELSTALRLWSSRACWVRLCHNAKIAECSNIFQHTLSMESVIHLKKTKLTLCNMSCPQYCSMLRWVGLSCYMLWLYAMSWSCVSLSSVLLIIKTQFLMSVTEVQKPYIYIPSYSQDSVCTWLYSTTLMDFSLDCPSVVITDQYWTKASPLFSSV